MPQQFTTEYQSGPLAKLEQSGYNVHSFSYPIDITADPGQQHFVVFYINESSNTQFKTVAQNGLLEQGGQSPQPLSGSPAVNSPDNVTTWSKRPIRRVSTAIALYMPQISTTYTPVWEGVDMNAAGGAVKAGQEGQIGRMLGEIGVGVASNALADAKDFLKATLGADVQTEDMVSMALRAARNPHMEMLFRTIGFREYQFDFKFTPRSEQEAVAVANIIKAFTFYASPEVRVDENGPRFYIYPAEFDIEFWSNGKPNNFVKKISTCCCTGINVNNTPSGAWSAFRAGEFHGVPVETNLTLSFKEVEIITKNRVLQGY